MKTTEACFVIDYDEKAGGAIHTLADDAHLKTSHL